MRFAWSCFRREWAPAVIAGLLATVVGCSNDSVGPSRPLLVSFDPLLYGVTLPESVATGDSIDVVVHLASDGHSTPEAIWSEPVGLRHVRVRVRSREVDSRWPVISGTVEVRKRLRLAEPGTWTIEVVGQDAMQAEVVVGDAPLGPAEHRFALQPRVGSLSPHTQVILYWGPPDAPETLRVDPYGKGAAPLPCASRAWLRRQFYVQGWSSFYQFDESPDDCVRSRRSWFYR